jgi:hypothetical protein
MFTAVYKNSYDATGDDENNTFAKWTPTARLDFNVANPALWDTFTVGEEYYVDFTPASK